MERWVVKSKSILRFWQKGLIDGELYETLYYVLKVGVLRENCQEVLIYQMACVTTGSSTFSLIAGPNAIEPAAEWTQNYIMETMLTIFGTCRLSVPDLSFHCASRTKSDNVVSKRVQKSDHGRDKNSFDDGFEMVRIM